MGLSAFERETNLLMNDESDMATIYTAQPSMMRKLAKHPQAKLLKRHRDDSGRVTGEEWELPKALVGIRTKRILSEAQKDSLRRARASAGKARTAA